jgi:hypothetical protein
MGCSMEARLLGNDVLSDFLSISGTKSAPRILLKRARRRPAMLMAQLALAGQPQTWKRRYRLDNMAHCACGSHSDIVRRAIGR